MTLQLNNVNHVTVDKMAAPQLVDFSKHEFREPQRLVKGPEDMDKWLTSQAYNEFMGFVNILNEAVKGKKLTDDVPTSPIIDKLLKMVEKLSGWVDEMPPVEQPQRFGNKAFRSWWEKIRDNVEGLLGELLPDQVKPAIVELKFYFKQSFGNPTRIDYGTGHEFKFCVFLCCLMKLGVVSISDAAALVLKVFEKYLGLVRKLQTVYRMEPAGSHGVWGLDDFQFLPFIWGSAQFIGHPKLEPKSFVDADTAEAYAKDYMFMGCIKYINSVKTGPFAEHSNTLWNISGVHEWTKVNSGLIKMFKEEVLGKFPVVQHFPFGTILSYDQVQST